MDMVRHFQSLAWCKPDWCFPSMSKETNELLRQCANSPQVETGVPVNFNDITSRSDAFPVPFPVQSVRLKTLKDTRDVETLTKNIESTYPIIHERVLLLMTHFLIYKREFGSSIEKALYKDMTLIEFIDRILMKRAISFVGRSDAYKLITGEEGSEGWESVGTMQQRSPLLLESCLSYDEMKLSAMLYVSGLTACINDGTRKNAGQPNETAAEPQAVIIGVIGPRFKRLGRMDYEDVLITAQQNCAHNGYGEEVTPTTCLNVLKTTYVRNNLSAKHMWRQMWAEFYQVHSYTHEELTSYVDIQEKNADQQYLDRYVKLPRDLIFDNEVYYKRISIIADCTLVEAEERAKEEGKDAFINVIGCGLGVWKIAMHQDDVYVLTFLERVRSLLKRRLLQHVSDVNFSYINVQPAILDIFKRSSDATAESDIPSIFFESKGHPRGGINVQLERREPSARLAGAHAGKLLVLTYPWDSNAHPGNEFWLGSLTTSGDPAAACSTQVSELHNAHVNVKLRATHARVVTATGLLPLAAYCAGKLHAD